MTLLLEYAVEGKPPKPNQVVSKAWMAACSCGWVRAYSEGTYGRKAARAYAEDALERHVCPAGGG